MKSVYLIRISVLMIIAIFFVMATSPTDTPIDSSSTIPQCCRQHLRTANSTTTCQVISQKASSKVQSDNPKSKSVLDAEALETPFSFFKDFSSSEENENDAMPQSNIIITTAKALAAILLSTII